MYLYASPSGVDDSISIVMPGFTYGEMMRKFYPNIHGEDTGYKIGLRCKGEQFLITFCALSVLELQFRAQKNKLIQINTDTFFREKTFINRTVFFKVLFIYYVIQFKDINRPPPPSVMIKS